VIDETVRKERLWLEKRRGREKEGKSRLGISEEKDRLNVAGLKIGVTQVQS